MENQELVVALTEEEIARFREILQKLKAAADMLAVLVLDYEAKKASILSAHQAAQQEVHEAATQALASHNLDGSKQWVIDFDRGLIKSQPEVAPRSIEAQPIEAPSEP